MKLKLALALTLICGQVFWIAPASATVADRFVVCSCSTEVQARAYAKQQTTEDGMFRFEVFNVDLNKLWVVNVERSPEDVPKGYIIIATSRAGTTGETQEWVSTAETARAIEKGMLVGPLPADGFGTSSFSQHTPEAVSLHIRASPSAPNIVTTRFRAIWGRLFGVRPVFVVVIFANGDTAIFLMTNPLSGSICCQYVLGTARNAGGDSIQDSDALGGTDGRGIASSGSYVVSTPSGSVTVVIPPGGSGCKSIDNDCE